MAQAIARKPEFKDFTSPQSDSQGPVQNYSQRRQDYNKALKEWEASQKKGGEKTAAATEPTAPTPLPTTAAGSGAIPTAPAPVTAPSAAPTTGAAGGTVPPGGAPAATASTGFNLKTPHVTRDSANESKGEFGSAQFEAKFNKIANQIVGIYNEQMPMLRNYDKMVQTQIDTLIGETMPQVQELFRQSGEQYGYAKDFYEQGANYDTAGRRETERGKAMTDVRMAGEASRSQAIERLESFGVDPSQARGAALDQNLRLQTALAQAQAGSEAELGVEERGREYTAQGLDAMGRATSQTAAATTAGAGILEGNARAQMAAKQGAIQTGEAGSNLLGAAGQQIQSSAGARQAKASSIAARQAAKGPSGLNAAIGGISQIGGTALAAYLGNPMAFGGGGAAAA